MSPRRRPRFVLVLVLAVLWGGGAAASWAAIDAFTFESPAHEAQYRNLIDELRCPKCLNTNLSGSDSPIAADLRREVYRLVEAGRSDEEIRTYLVDRYGDFILYRPRLTPWSVALYATPAVLVLLGFAVIALMVRRSRRRSAVVGADEQTRLAAVLARHDGAAAASSGARTPPGAAAGH